MKKIIRIASLSAAFFCTVALADKGVTYQDVIPGKGAVVQLGQMALVEKRFFEWSATAKDGRGKLVSIDPQKWIVAGGDLLDAKNSNGVAGMHVGGTRVIFQAVENTTTGQVASVVIQVKVIDAIDHSTVKTKTNSVQSNDQKS